jgi:hypothetical protein
MKIRLETHQVLPPGGFFYALTEYALTENLFAEISRHCCPFMAISGSQANASSLQSSRKIKYSIQ